MVATCAVAMGVTASWGLDRGSVWRDEAATLSATRRSVTELWRMVHHVDVVHGLYYLLMHVWGLPGSGEVWVRVPSVLAAAATAGVVAVIAARLVGLRTALLSGLTFATIPLVSFYAQELRSYMLVCLGVALATLLLVRALEVDRWRRWAAYAAVATLTAWLHELAVLMLAAHAATLVLSRVPRRTWIRWGVAFAVTTGALTPLVLMSTRQSAQVSWLTTPGLGTAVRAYAQLAGTRPVAIGVMAAAVLLGATAPEGPSGGRPHLVAVAAPLLLLPPGLLLAASQWRPLFSERYVLYAVVGVVLLAGRGVDRGCAWLTTGLRTRLSGPAGRHLASAVGVVLIVAVFAVQLPTQLRLRTVASRSDDLAAAAAVVATRHQPGDDVLFLPDRYRLAAIAYPAAFGGLPDLSLRLPAADAGNLRGRDRPVAATRRAMLAATRVWVLGRTGLAVRTGERAAAAEREVLTRYFRRAESVRVHGVEVDLFVRTRSG